MPGPSSTLAQHNVLEGSLLTLILTPPTRDDETMTDACTVAQIVAQRDLDPSEGELLAYGKRMGGSVLRGADEAKSLYARCGGIFGIAAFVDRCMDEWMADPILNANDAVATWHERAQRCGFKFLVTQLISYQCGGPQVYTGRDMAASHKHLNISEEEWASFMATLANTCDIAGLPGDDMADLFAVISSMRTECVLAPGEKPPRNPGPKAAAKPDDKFATLYAKLGGICACRSVLAHVTDGPPCFVSPSPRARR